MRRLEYRRRTSNGICDVTG